MNHKNILFFSCFFVININTIPLNNNLEHAKKELLNCRNMPFRYDCRKQEKAYNEAKKAFLVPLRAMVEEGIKANKELLQMPPSWLTIFYSNKDKKDQLEQKKLLAYAASGFVEALIVRNGPKFESNYYDNKTFNDFCNDVIETFVVNNCTRSTYASDMMGPLEATQKQLEETKKVIREMLEKIL